MRAVLIGIGSLGDTLPFIALGKALARRGHEVVLGANGQYADLIARHGLPFVDVFPADEYRRFVADHRQWTAKQAFATGRNLMRLWMVNSYNLVAEKFQPGETVVVSVGCAFGSRIARETLGAPLVTVHLQPMWMRSVQDGTALPRGYPKVGFRAVEWLVDQVIDRVVRPSTNEFRASFGLPPVRRLMREWWQSPDLVLNFFPEWFSTRQEDWPPNTFCAGFPRTDDLHDGEVDERLDAFLDAGDPPIVFAQSSVGGHEEFFAVSREVGKRLGRRSILVMERQEGFDDPNGAVFVTPFLRLDRALPRCAALVHHGGIGTIAAGLGAGVCQLTIPNLPDQFDNAHRLQRLGVSVLLKRKQYEPLRASEELRRLLESPTTTARRAELREKAARDDGLGAACEAIEALHERTRASAVAR